MKQFMLAMVFCLAVSSLAYGQVLNELTSAAKDKATKVAGDTAKSIADDGSITAEIKAKIISTTSLKDAQIEVSTVDGAVSLTGTVKNKQAKGMATKIAKKVKGVKSVDNKITIEKSAKKTKKTAK
ncbi:MAG: BON domain-containing protein [Syntrophaceae bacterium]|jgi:hyperosmotically inducible periplasmic protein|nr:BON domain-containing protein [Syntrophaceae bacterium]